MRIWTLHPKYLDPPGLTALWREALLARQVLLNRTRGYRHHPQLDRFRAQARPVAAINSYLAAIHREAESRGYRFDAAKIGRKRVSGPIPETRGQVAFEWGISRRSCVCGAQSGWGHSPRSAHPRSIPCFASCPDRSARGRGHRERAHRIRGGGGIMKPLRSTLFVVSALLMVVGAVGYSFAVVPDLHGDLLEIGVRPRVLGSTVLHLYFAGIAMFGFALMVCAAAVQTIRGVAPPRLPLAVVAVIYTLFGILAFSRSHSPHHFAPLMMGVLLGAALAIPESGSSHA
jgi:hypothetical protein